MPGLARTAAAALLAGLLGGCSLASSVGASAFSISDVDQRPH